MIKEKNIPFLSKHFQNIERHESISKILSKISSASNIQTRQKYHMKTTNKQHLKYVKRRFQHNISLLNLVTIKEVYYSR